MSGDLKSGLVEEILKVGEGVDQFDETPQIVRHLRAKIEENQTLFNLAYPNVFVCLKIYLPSAGQTCSYQASEERTTVRILFLVLTGLDLSIRLV